MEEYHLLLFTTFSLRYSQEDDPNCKAAVTACMKYNQNSNSISSRKM